MADFSLRLELKGLLIGAAAAVFLKNTLVLRVHQIKVEIVHAAGGQLTLKQRPYLLLTLEQVGQLVRQNKFISLVSRRKAFAYCYFAFAAQITVRGVKIIKTAFDKRVDHFVEFAIIDFAAVHR